MGTRTGIEWTDTTWNPVTGCTRVSPGCTNCYIDWSPPFRIADRHFRDAEGNRSHAMGSTTGVLLHPDRLPRPVKWTKPRRVFVNSMSDLFHEEVPDDFIVSVFATMLLSPQHTFQVLTKRHGRMRSLVSRERFIESPSGWLSFEDAVRNKAFNTRNSWSADKVASGPIPDIADTVAWPLPNVHLGVTVEDQERADLRVPALLGTPAAVRFLSCEPLLGAVTLTGEGRDWLAPASGAGVDWVIVGGESGTKARPMHPQWARTLRDECAAAEVPYLFKQWGEWAPWESSEATAYDTCHLDETGKARLYAHRNREGVVELARVGKKNAGRRLDDVLHDGYPGS